MAKYFQLLDTFCLHRCMISLVMWLALCVVVSILWSPDCKKNFFFFIKSIFDVYFRKDMLPSPPPSSKGLGLKMNFRIMAGILWSRNKFKGKHQLCLSRFQNCQSKKKKKMVKKLFVSE